MTPQLSPTALQELLSTATEIFRNRYSHCSIKDDARLNIFPDDTWNITVTAKVLQEAPFQRFVINSGTPLELKKLRYRTRGYIIRNKKGMAKGQTTDT